MCTDFSLHFQWANNYSEPVPCLCTFCQPKMPTGTTWSFSNAKADVCSCRQHGLEVFCCSCLFFFFPDRICGHNHPFNWYRSIFPKWSVASWLSWALFCKREKGGFLIKETSLCSHRRKMLVFNFHFLIWFARKNIFLFIFQSKDMVLSALCVTWSLLYYLIDILLIDIEYIYFLCLKEPLTIAPRDPFL